MKLLRRGFLALGLLLLASGLQPVSAQKKLQEWPGVVLRPVFVSDNLFTFPGTAFLVKAQNGKHYALSAAHLIKDKEWKEVRAVGFMTTGGKVVAKAVGKPLYRGKENQYAPLGGKKVVTYDLLVWEVHTIGPVRALKLAKTAPAKGEPAWIVGRMHKDLEGKEKLYPARLVEVRAERYWLKREYKFDPHGFSGGPVVNKKSEVIGNVIAGNDEGYVTGASADHLRKKLKELGIFVD